TFCPPALDTRNGDMTSSSTNELARGGLADESVFGAESPLAASAAALKSFLSSTSNTFQACDLRASSLTASAYTESIRADALTVRTAPRFFIGSATMSSSFCCRNAISALLARWYDSLGRAGGAAVAVGALGTTRDHSPAARTVPPTNARNRCVTDISSGRGVGGGGEQAGDRPAASRRVLLQSGPARKAPTPDSPDPGSPRATGG